MDLKKIRRQIKNDKSNFKLVLIIVFIILLIGIVFYAITEKKKKEVKEELTDKEKKRIRLAEVKKQIAFLEPQKEKLENKEWWLFLYARIFIAIMIIVINVLYLLNDNWHCFSLSKQLNINTGMLFIYSFTAFLLYGTPTALVNGMKKWVSKRMLKNNVHILTELENLQKEEIELEEYFRDQEEK